MWRNSSLSRYNDSLGTKTVIVLKSNLFPVDNVNNQEAYCETKNALAL